MDLYTIHKICQRVTEHLSEIDKSKLDKDSIDHLQQAKKININVLKAIYDKINEPTVQAVNPN